MEDWAHTQKTLPQKQTKTCAVFKKSHFYNAVTSNLSTVCFQNDTIPC